MNRVSLIVSTLVVQVAAAAANSKGHDAVHRRDVESAGDTSNCSSEILQEYNLNLHIAAIFVLLVASFFGVILPACVRLIVTAAAKRGANAHKLRRRVNDAIFGFQHFGSGIILSTAFIHLLHDAFESFESPCIGKLSYEPTSAAICLAAIWCMFIIDFLGLRPLRRRACPSPDCVSQQSSNDQAFASSSGGVDGSASVAKDNTLVNRATPHIGFCGHGNVFASQDDDDDVETNAAAQNEEQDDEAQSSISSIEATKEAARHHLAKFEVITLESGIVFHSMIIGVTLGTGSGDGWIAFFVAIAIHQFCEGIALASRIVILRNASRRLKASMYCAFSLVTSVGIAIGIGVRQSFNGNDASTALAIGVLNSISAGILIYSALVQILAGDFMHNQGMLWASTPRAISAIALITLGLIIMSVLGKWA